MDVVWLEEAVRGRGGGPRLWDDPELRVFGYAEPWADLSCEHHARGRSEWTPFVIRWERRADGGKRQELLFRLPTIRSCCITDDFRRAAWWHDVDWAVRVWGEADAGALRDELMIHRAEILAEIRALIPKPTPAGVRAFADFRAERDDEDAARDLANQRYWEAMVQQDQARRWTDRAGSGFGSGSHAPRSGPTPAGDCFAVLRLRPDATLAQVKARHRSLVLLHHPDRGGDPAEFLVVQDAYERALTLVRGRPGK